MTFKILFLASCTGPYANVEDKICKLCANEMGRNLFQHVVDLRLQLLNKDRLCFIMKYLFRDTSTPNIF